MTRVLFLAFAVALVGVVSATSLSRTYLPPQVVQPQRTYLPPAPRVVSVPRVHVQPQIVHRPVIQPVVVPQRTYLPPAPRAVPHVVSISRPAARLVSRPAPQVIQNTYLPPPVAAPVNTYLPPQVVAPRNTYLPPQVVAPRNTYLPPQ